MGLTRPRAAQIYDLDYKQATRVITVANVTLTGGAPAVVDGVSLVLGDRVLVTGQSTASQNGLYDVTVVGVGSDGTWARTSDGNATGEILAGMIVMVTEGSVYADTQWKLTTDNPIIIGTTGLTFVINILSSVGGANTQVQVNDGGTLAGFSNFVFDKTSNILSVTGNISATGNVNGNYILGNGSQLSGIITTVDANTLIGNTLSSNIVNSSLTSTGILGSLSVTGNIVGGNVISDGARVYKWTTQANTAPSNAVPGDNWYDSYADKLYLYVNDGTGNQWVDQSSPTTFSSLNVIGNTASGNLLTAGQVSAAGNITGGNVLTSGLISATSTITSAATITGGNIATGGTSSATGNITGGNVLTGGLISATGTVTGGNLATGGTVSAAGNITGGNVLTSGLISATGNVSGGNLNVTGNIVDTGALTIITGASGNVTLAPNGTGVVVATTTGANITGTLNATGNGIIAGRDLAIGGTFNSYTTSGRSTVVMNGGASGAIFEMALSNTSSAYLYSTTTDMQLINLRGGNLLLTTNSSLTWTIFNTGILSGTGNVQGGNLRTTGIISATGNITGGNVLGGANVNATTHTGTTVSVTGNITGGNLLISGSISDSAQLDINTTAGNANIVLTPNGTGNVNISSNIMPTANATANIGSATSSFNTVFAMATSAQYADLAEMYEADAAYAPGTVLEFGGDKEVTISNTPFSPLVIGVVSTNPAYLMNSAAQGKYMAAIALVGRVPTRVIGPVSKGAMMVSAGNGHARSAAAPSMGTVIGKAVEDFTGESGVIEITIGRL